MSRRHKYDTSYESTTPNFYMLLIVILIVLQWFRVGYPSAAGAAPGVLPESNLVNNGGLFIITLFFLVACNCESSQKNYREQRHHHFCRQC